MAEIQFKPLEADNLFDFCAVLDAIGAEKITDAIGNIGLDALSTGNAKSVGAAVLPKMAAILIREMPKARGEVYGFFANCTEWDNGKHVSVDELKHMRISAFFALIRDFFKQEDITDFFRQAAELLDMEQEGSMNSASEDTEETGTDS